MAYKLVWVCDNCYKRLCLEIGKGIEVYTVANVFQALCNCGELATSLIDWTVVMQREVDA
jgi:hypothetical protein